MRYTHAKARGGRVLQLLLFGATYSETESRRRNAERTINCAEQLPRRLLFLNYLYWQNLALQDSEFEGVLWFSLP